MQEEDKPKKKEIVFLPQHGESMVLFGDKNYKLKSEIMDKKEKDHLTIIVKIHGPMCPLF